MKPANKKALMSIFMGGTVLHGRDDGQSKASVLVAPGDSSSALAKRAAPRLSWRMDHLASARFVIETEIEGMRRMAGLLDGRFVEAIEILRRTLEQRGKVVVIGVGKSGNIGQKIAATLNSTGATAVVLDSQNALHGDLGLLSDGDAVLALSYSGETRELLDLMPFIKRFEVKVISMTGKPGSTLSRLSEVTLDTSVEREACPLNLAPTSSSTAMLAMGDALAMVLLEARGFTNEDFARFHPGGSLGRALLTRVSDIMRSDQALPTVGEEADVFAALDTMNRARAGACLILDAKGGLAGIFTHGDFARSFRVDPLLGEKPVVSLMTRRPITVRSDALAVEVLRTLGQNRVDDIVVLDVDGKPVGLIDSQDLARLKIV
ncbi:MAG: KpsF/GutQ family sugar-phosphate isomerase [Luteolibacter sp.]|nr:KpsF/GutQ family sugar-phosphate isomerase [Luteolibacter sp.]